MTVPNRWWKKHTKNHIIDDKWRAILYFYTKPCRTMQNNEVYSLEMIFFSKCGALQDQMIHDWFWSYLIPIIHKTYSDIFQVFPNVFCFIISWEEQFLHKPESVMIKMILVWHQYGHFDLKMLLFFLNVISLRWFEVNWFWNHQYSDANLHLLFLENSSKPSKKIQTGSNRSPTAPDF